MMFLKEIAQETLRIVDEGKYISAYSPDLLGCVATGKARDQAARNMHEAIEIHVRGLLENKLPVPQSRSFAEYIAIRA